MAYYLAYFTRSHDISVNNRSSVGTTIGMRYIVIECRNCISFSSFIACLTKFLTATTTSSPTTPRNYCRFSTHDDNNSNYIAWIVSSSLNPWKYFVFDISHKHAWWSRRNVKITMHVTWKAVKCSVKGALKCKLISQMRRKPFQVFISLTFSKLFA